MMESSPVVIRGQFLALAGEYPAGNTTGENCQLTPNQQENPPSSRDFPQ
ncbi:MAG: hypothetical protein SFX18_07635 [Pirellulales bacterium]|nr:hypothetical protein [Pirellulales bacterium]